MLKTLDLKIRQMHQALQNLVNPDLSGLTVEYGETPAVYYCQLDFNQGQSV